MSTLESLARNGRVGAAAARSTVPASCRRGGRRHGRCRLRHLPLSRRRRPALLDASLFLISRALRWARLSRQQCPDPAFLSTTRGSVQVLAEGTEFVAGPRGPTYLSRRTRVPCSSTDNSPSGLLPCVSFPLAGIPTDSRAAAACRSATRSLSTTAVTEPLRWRPETFSPGTRPSHHAKG